MKGKEYKLMVKIAGEVDKTFGTSLNTIKKEVKNVKKLTADETFNVLDKGFDKMANVGKKALNTIKRAAELATAAVAGIGVAATNAGKEFEAAMATVEAISGADESQMTQLTEKARELSRDSIYSATEVADAMQYMGMAGWKTEQILAGIEPVLDLATASGEEFAMVSDIVTDNLTAFNMEAEEAGRLADVLAAAAMNSNTNVEKMGQTFKYAGTVAGALGMDIENVAIATGLMASAGIKESMAGTALRNMLSRMTKTTKDSKKAMEAFGITLYDDSGKAKSLMEIMEQMRKASKEMTEEQKASYAAGLAGQRGMSGLLAILNASEKDFKNLTEAIYNSEGAAAEMAATKTDNLNADLEILKNNVQDAGIELYGTFSGTLREWAQSATEFLQKNIKKIPKWVNEVSAYAATFKRKAGKFIEPIFNFIVNTGKWLIKNKNAVIGVLVGIGTTIASYKIASGISHTVTSITSFIHEANPLARAITGVAAAIGVVTGAIAAYKAHEQELIDNDLAEHFGNLSLSMSELNDVAHAIVDDGELLEMKKQLEAFDELDALRDDIQSHFDSISKINWKIEMGFELTSEEMENYKSDIEEASKLQQEFAEGTAMEVAKLFPENDAVSQKVKKFYMDNVDTMHTLGKALADAVTEAYSENVLDTSKVDKIIDIQKQMAEVQEAMALGEREANLALLGERYGGAKLNDASFQNLQKELEEVTKENKEIIDETYKKKYGALYATYGGAIPESALAELNSERARKMAEQDARAVQFQIDTIKEAYKTAIADYTGNREGAVMDMIYEWMYGQPGSTEALIREKQGLADYVGITDTQRKAIKQLMDNLKPQLESLLLDSEAKGLTDETREALKKQVNDIMLEVSEIYATVGEARGWETDLYNTLNKMLEEGSLDEGQQEAARIIMETVQQLGGVYAVAAETEAKKAYNDKSDIVEEAFKDGITVQADLNLLLNPEIDVLKPKLVSLSEIKLWNAINGVENHASGGLVKDLQLSWLGEQGPEMVVPLDGSRRSLALWEQAGQFMNGSLMDRYNISGGSSEPAIEYSPVLQFYGDSPSKDDLSDALRISQDEFEDLIEKYFKKRARLAF